MGSNARRRTQLMAIDGLEFSKELKITGTKRIFEF